MDVLGNFLFAGQGEGGEGGRGRRAEAPCNGACLTLAPLAIPDQRPAVFPRESVAAVKYIPLAGTEKMFAQSPILPTDCTGYPPDWDFSLVTSASPYMGEWVLACLQRKVFRGGRGRGTIAMVLSSKTAQPCGFLWSLLCSYPGHTMILKGSTR